MDGSMRRAASDPSTLKIFICFVLGSRVSLVF
jgi:hypothetical protein